MSLDTLLEAAQYIEWSTTSTPKTRARTESVSSETTKDFHQYAKTAPPKKETSIGTDEGKGDGANSGSDDSTKDTKRRAGGAGTREVHNKLEKNRRAHLKECFDNLKLQIPHLDDKKISNLHILRSSLRYIQTLKRKEKEYEQEVQRLAQEKIRAQERIAALKRDLVLLNIDVDINHFMQSAADKDSHSISTATADNESPIMSDDEEESVTFLKPQVPAAFVPKPIPVASTVVMASSSSHPPVLQTNTGRPQGISTPSQPVTVTTQTVRTPVTQLLQKTIQQRAFQQHFLQQQRLQQQMASSNAQVVTVSAGQLRAMAPNTLRPTAQLQQQTLSLNQVMPSIITPLTLGQANSLTAIGKLVPSTVQQSNVTASSTATSLSTTIVTTGGAGTTPQVSIAAPTTPVTFAAMKHIITAPITHIPAHLVANNQMATLGSLVTAARPTTANTVSTNTLLTPAAATLHGLPSVISSIGPVAPAGSQMVSPISMVSPIQVAGGLQQVVNPQLLKSLGHIPIIQQPISLSHLVKPLVMVTVPQNVGSTNTAPQTVQVAVTASKAS